MKQREAQLCSICHHAPIMHVEDGLGTATCAVCLKLRELSAHDTTYRGVCSEKFIFRISKAEQEQARAASKELYPQKQYCLNCAMMYMQHWGVLCPDGNSTFLPLIQTEGPHLIG
jgi:hypothetical protein